MELRGRSQHLLPIVTGDDGLDRLGQAFVGLGECFGRFRHRVAPSLGGFRSHTSAGYATVSGVKSRRDASAASALDAGAPVLEVERAAEQERC